MQRRNMLKAMVAGLFGGSALPPVAKAAAAAAAPTPFRYIQFSRLFPLRPGHALAEIDKAWAFAHKYPRFVSVADTSWGLFFDAAGDYLRTTHGCAMQVDGRWEVFSLVSPPDPDAVVLGASSSPEAAA